MSKVSYDPFANGSIEQYINRAIMKAIKELQTCIPAIVKEVKARDKVIVSPAIQQTSADWKSFAWADITVPVYTPAGNSGKAVLSFPVKAGDVGWVISGDLDPTLFYQDTSKPARQGVYDRHNYRYGFFLPAKITEVSVDSSDADGVVIKNNNSKIVIKENEIDIVSNNELKINAKSVNITSEGNNISIDGTNWKQHTHGVGTLQVPVTSAEGSPSTITGSTGGVS